MPIRPLNNPYDSHDRSEKDSVSCYVSCRDHAYVNAKVPILVGKDDKILSLLYATLVSRLRAYESVHGPLDPAFHNEHDTYAIVLELIGGDTDVFPSLPPSGRPAGQPRPQHDLGGASSVRPENECVAGLSADEKGRNARRIEGKEKGGGEKLVQPRPGTPREIDVEKLSPTLLAKLNLKGVL